MDYLRPIAIMVSAAIAFVACAGRAGGDGAAPSAATWAPRLQWNAALAEHDSGALAQLVDDSAVHISPTFVHTGREAFLAQFLGAMAARPGFLLVYTPAQVTTCTRNDCSVVTEYGTWRESWLEEGEATTVGGTYYALWQRRDAQWQIRTEAFATMYCQGRHYCK